MQKKKNLLAVALVALLALSCATAFLAEDTSAAAASATKDGVTVNYSESGDQAWLYFSFASGSAIKGDSVFVKVNDTSYGTLDLLTVPYVYLGAKTTGALTISLTQDGRNVTMTLSPSGSYHGIFLTQPANGTIASDKYSAAEGEKVTLTATPSSGYVLVNWKITPSVTVTNNTFIMPAGDVTVTAEFAQTTLYMVNTEVEGSGVLTASQNFAAVGATVTLTVTPGSDSEFKEWKDKSPSSLQITEVNKTTYTFKMPAENVSVKAVFQEAAPHAYTVKTSPSDGGAVKPASGNAKPGAPVQFTVTPSKGCTVLSVTSVPSIQITSMENVYGFVMPSEDVTITVTFKTAQTYNITVNSASGGSVEASATKSIEGETVSVAIKPNSGYVFDKWVSKTPSNLELTKVDSTLYTFVMPAGEVKLTPSFKQQTDITKDAKNGSISVKIDSDVTADSVLSLTVDTPAYAKQVNIPKDAKVYTVTSTLKTDGKTVDLAGKKITLSLAYTIPAGQSVDDLKVYYVSADGSVVERQTSSYDDGCIIIEHADGSKLSASTYAVVTEMLTHVPAGTIGVRDGANGYVTMKIGGDVTQSTSLELSIKNVKDPPLKNIPGNALTYDVSLVAKNGSTKVDLSNSTVTLYLDASSMTASKTLYAYYVSNDGKTVEKMSASPYGDDMRFNVTHFSMYVLSYEEIKPLEGGDDSSMLMIIAIVVIIVVLLIAVILFSRRKSGNGTSRP